MFIDRYKKEDGYYDENGCFYEDGECKLATFLCWNVNWCATDDTSCGGFYPEFEYKFLKIEE
jgi:hypothetical protein